MEAPAKQWRVAVPQLGSSDYFTLDEAQAVAHQCREAGHWVVIRRWWDGKWITAEKLEPLAQNPAEEGSMGTDYVKFISPNKSTSISARERAIIVLRFAAAEPLTHAELAKVFDTTPEQVRMIEAYLLRKLYSDLAPEYPRMDVDEMLKRAVPRELP